MKTFILTTVILFNATASFAQFDFDNKRSENPIVGADIADANPHLFMDDPFYGYEHFSFVYNKREISSDTVIDERYKSKGEFVFWLSFNEEKDVYQINLFNFHRDSVQDRLISCGNIKRTKEKFLFLDKQNGSCLEAELLYVNNWWNILTFNGKSFPHFKRKAFEWGGHPNLELAKALMDSTYIASILKSTKLKLPIRKPTIGSFSSEDMALFLLLEKDSSYRYYVCGLLLSEGTWKQKGQRIDLHDKHLKHTFHGKVTNQGIWSGYWPGDMEGTLLRRIGE